jgi:membrane-associated protease RseP (regulator of RpoE activity)
MYGAMREKIYSKDLKFFHVCARRTFIAICFVYMTVFFLGNAACARRPLSFTHKYILGVRAQELTRNLRIYLGYSNNILGIVIQEIEPDLIGYQSGLQIGDVITTLNGRPVISIRDAIIQINDSKGYLDVRYVRASTGSEAAISKRIKLEPAPASPTSVTVSSQYGKLYEDMLRAYVNDLFKVALDASPL